MPGNQVPVVNLLGSQKDYNDESDGAFWQTCGIASDYFLLLK